ncbi:hypothetical protein ACPRNU_20645 [Chromobacterium vaccinii]|uniref:hypothetical protein n=1 Tax=Chromobacterium vaccinii TaxID=1108595 RepID=UPI003C73855C
METPLSLSFPLAGCRLACGVFLVCEGCLMRGLLNQYQFAVAGQLQTVQLSLVLDQDLASGAEQLAAVQQRRGDRLVRDGWLGIHLLMITIIIDIHQENFMPMYLALPAGGIHPICNFKKISQAWLARG